MNSCQKPYFHQQVRNVFAKTHQNILIIAGCQLKDEKYLQEKLIIRFFYFILLRDISYELLLINIYLYQVQTAVKNNERKLKEKLEE